ncbi:MAG: hypothetical protein E7593_05570 [Ruminococcaceae bacterium]|nr:hypothetical protein [Oscillospiraceae bacterium]
MNKVLRWLDNFWYHYKWHTIIAVFAAVFLCVGIGQMLGKEKVDAYIMYAGPTSFFPNEIEQIQDSFENIVPDFNGDGKKVVEFIDITVLTDKQIAENKKKAQEQGVEYNLDMEFVMDMRKKFKLQIQSGDAYFLLIDPEMYEQDKEVGIYRKLADLGIEYENTNDEMSVVFRETEFGKYFTVFEQFPEDTLMCFRTMNIPSKIRGDKEKKKYDQQLEFFKDILEFEIVE